MADSLNPFDDERFSDSAAAAHADDDDLSAAEEALEGHHRLQKQSEMIGRNGHHLFPGPLGGSATPKGGDPGRRRLLPVALGIVGVIVILSCLGVGAVITMNLLSVQTSLNNPQTTLDDFYSALHIKDYQTAYDQLSSSYQSRLTPSSFRATFELIGTIESYQISNVQTQSSQASATVKVTLVKPDTSTTVNETKTVQLVQESGSWKIDRVDPSLTRVIWPVGRQMLALNGG